MLTVGGGEFRNQQMQAFASKHDFRLSFTAGHLTWSDGLNERNHFTIDKTVETLTDENYNRRSDKTSYVQLQQPNKEKWFQSNPLVFGKQNII